LCVSGVFVFWTASFDGLKPLLVAFQLLKGPYCTDQSISCARSFI